MMDNETYRKELVRMWDSVREDNKGYHGCRGVNCKKCPLYFIKFGDIGCGDSIYAVEMINIVKKWSKEHPLKKYKVSRMEYDILKSYLYYKNHMTVDIADYFFEDGLLLSLLKKGYFKGATKEMLINDYLNDCEVDE